LDRLLDRVEVSMLRVLIAVGLCLLATTAVACGEDENGNPISESEREEFIQDVEERIAELRNDLERLREDIASGDANAEIEEQAESAERRLNDAESELEEIRNASDDEWEALKNSIDETLNDAGELVEEIASEAGVN
jgi:predicted  nucleic acid-binding Zn-ribbon protein